MNSELISRIKTDYAKIEELMEKFDAEDYFVESEIHGILHELYDFVKATDETEEEIQKAFITAISDDRNDTLRNAVLETFFYGLMVDYVES